VLGVLLALTGLLLLISAAAFPERTRPDMLIYGRYTEIVAPALIAFGLVALARVRRTFGPDSGQKGRRTLVDARGFAWPLAGFGALTALVVLIRVTASDPDAPNRWNISALPFVTVELGPAILIGAALVAAAGSWLLLRASSLGTRTLGLAVLLLFLPVVAYGAWNPVRSGERAVYPSGWTSPQEPAEEAGAREIAYDLDHYDTIGLYVFQWFLPDSRISLFHGGREAPPGRFVLSGADYAQQHPGAGAREIWSAAGRDQVLWRLSGRQAQ